MPSPTTFLSALFLLLQEVVPLLVVFLRNRLECGEERRKQQTELISRKKEKVREIVQSGDLGRLGTMLRGKFRLQDTEGKEVSAQSTEDVDRV